MEQPIHDEIVASIRTIPDYPHEGIIFRDVSTLFGNPKAFRQTVDELVQPYQDSNIKFVAGIEARGFILGGAIAHQLSCGFIPIRKRGKLPFKTVSIEYKLEYGTDVLEVHRDALQPGDRVLVVDDLLATGGTALAAINLLRQLQAEVVASCFVVDLPELGGRDAIKAEGVPVRYLVEFEGK